MKSIIIVAVVLSLAYAYPDQKYTHGHNGKPNCDTDVEMSRPWRNNFDPVHYWVCLNQHQAAVQVICPIDHGFMDSPDKFGCVPWTEWGWTAPYDPPSMA